MHEEREELVKRVFPESTGSDLLEVPPLVETAAHQAAGAPHRDLSESRDETTRRFHVFRTPIAVASVGQDRIGSRGA